MPGGSLVGNSSLEPGCGALILAAWAPLTLPYLPPAFLAPGRGQRAPSSRLLFSFRLIPLPICVMGTIPARELEGVCEVKQVAGGRAGHRAWRGLSCHLPQCHGGRQMQTWTCWHLPRLGPSLQPVASIGSGGKGCRGGAMRAMCQSPPPQCPPPISPRHGADEHWDPAAPPCALALRGRGQRAPSLECRVY